MDIMTNMANIADIGNTGGIGNANKLFDEIDDKQYSWMWSALAFDELSVA